MPGIDVAVSGMSFVPVLMATLTLGQGVFVHTAGHLATARLLLEEGADIEQRNVMKVRRNRALACVMWGYDIV